jgi:Flp pilus assembly protein TadD
LTISINAPNACNHCHEDKSPKWAADTIVEWIGKEIKDKNHFGKAIHAGRLDQTNASRSLVELAGNNKQPDIARASAVQLLARYPSQTAVKEIIEGLRDPHPLVRMAAIEALEIIGPRQRFQPAEPLLSDPVRAIRIEAGRILSVVPQDTLSEKQRSILEKAIEEYEKAQWVNADHPSAHLNLGILYVNQRKWNKAEAEYKTSFHLDPNFVQGYINLADLYRYQGKDEEGEKILRAGLEKIQDNPEILHSLGLLLVRKKRMPEAIQALEKAATLRQENPRFSYVFAVALNSVGQSEKALTVLQKARDDHPFNRDILFTLVTMNRDAGRLDSALEYVRRLTELEPEDSRYSNLEKQLKAISESE